MKQESSPFTTAQAVARGLPVFMPGVLDDFFALSPHWNPGVPTNRDTRALVTLSREIAKEHGITLPQAVRIIRYSLSCLGVNL